MNFNGNNDQKLQTKVRSTNYEWSEQNVLNYLG